MLHCTNNDAVSLKSGESVILYLMKLSNLSVFRFQHHPKTECLLGRDKLTRIKSRSSGESIKAVNVLDTTVGGLFSGSLNRCYIKRNSSRV